MVSSAHKSTDMPLSSSRLDKSTTGQQGLWTGIFLYYFFIKKLFLTIYFYFRFLFLYCFAVKNFFVFAFLYF